MANVLVGATGSVAAVRVPALVDALTADGHAVKVVATDAAAYFFDPAAVGGSDPPPPPPPPPGGGEEGGGRGGHGGPPPPPPPPPLWGGGSGEGSKRAGIAGTLVPPSHSLPLPS